MNPNFLCNDGVEKRYDGTQKRWLSLRRWIRAGIALLSSIVAWHLLSSYYGEDEKALSSQLRQTIQEKFSERSAAFFQTFGLYSFETGEILSQGTVYSDAGIVLVHGLDEPGKVWSPLNRRVLRGFRTEQSLAPT